MKSRVCGWGLVPLPLISILILTVVVLVSGSGTLGAATFTASLDRDTITLGDTATLSLIFEDGTPQNVPQPADVAGLQISYVGPSSQFSFINGQTKSTVAYNFLLVPQKAGSFVIGGLTVELSGQVLKSQPVTLRVVQSAAAAAPVGAGSSGDSSQPAFLRLLTPRQDVYIGETTTVELDLFVQDGVVNADDLTQRFLAIGASLVNADGFKTLKSAAIQRRRVQVGNATYIEAPVMIALSPTKTGTLVVNSTNITANLSLPAPNQARQDMYDPFGMFRRVVNRQINLSAESVSVQSHPLPSENVPADFNGAVGSYSLTATAGPTNVAVGDPITVRVQISGKGELDALSLPNQPAWHDFKTYPPTTKVETTGELGIEGTKTFEQIVTPQSTDIHELPPFSFSFFDPDQKEYRTLTQASIALGVKPGSAAPVPAMAGAKSSETEAAVPQDIVPIKQRLGAVGRPGPPLAVRPWFLATQSVPLLAWLAALVWRRRADHLANHPRLRRRRQVDQMVRDGLTDLNRLALENNSQEFFATLFHLLQAQLGEWLDCPASAITESVIEEKLRPAGAADSAVESLHELFQACNQARYASVQGSRELAVIVSQFNSVSQSLRSSRK